MRKLGYGILFGVWALGALACGPRLHIGEDFGKASQEFYRRQAVHEMAAKEAPSGLDSEEAAIVHGNYQRKMSGTAAPAPGAQSQVLILEEPKGEKKK